MEPADCVSFIGRNSGDKHRYIATGDSGQGITNGVIASMLIANLVLDGNSPWVKAYDPAHMITKNIGGYLSENMTVLRSFAEYLTMGGCGYRKAQTRRRRIISQRAEKDRGLP
jgi:hypothetical protein